MDPINKDLDFSLIHDGDYLKKMGLSSELESHFRELKKHWLSAKPALQERKEILENPSFEGLTFPIELDERICPILLAGGQSTRLKFGAPKALFPLLGKSLIGHFCEKILKASCYFNKPLKAYVMVSEEGYEPILSHLKENRYFGLDPSQLILFVQSKLPLLTLENKLIRKSDALFHEGPNGNGLVFSLLNSLGVFEENKPSYLGFEIIPIDNPLAPLFSKAHAKAFEAGNDVSIKGIALPTPDSKMGRIGKVNTSCRIIEYSENPPDFLSLGNTGLLGFSYPFAEKMGSISDMPLHVALKNYLCLDNEEFKELTLQKFETFIFDLFSYAEKVHVYKGDASLFFAPLKEQEGPFGKKEVEKRLLLASSQVIR